VTERTSQRVYLDLQKLARDQGRNTQQLFELYIHERFLARVAESQFADKLVLKGGMLLVGDQGFPLLGYPLESVIAEKADTMMFLGDANTRDRDYGDIYLLSQIHTVKAEILRRALQRVAEHRGHEVHPLGPLLETLRESRQQPWEAFRTRAGLPGLPERFADVVDAVVYFIDGLQDRHGSIWNPATREWE
jgi:Nucleotidyl transferase AbiEii toxin, Type IV TA system